MAPRAVAMTEYDKRKDHKELEIARTRGEPIVVPPFHAPRPEAIRM